MTTSDKIRIYELSRDLNLENKDILDAAQKLSISVKSHSSSISAEEAKKIKNHINKKDSDKKILSINKSTSQRDRDTFKQNKEEKSSIISPAQENLVKKDSNKKPLLNKPLTKPEIPKTIPNQSKNLNKSNIINSPQTQANLINKNTNNKHSQNTNQDKKTLSNGERSYYKKSCKTTYSAY